MEQRRYALLEIRKAIDELGNDGDCPQLNSIAKCINRIHTILVEEGY